MDACMRELRATGLASNPARLNAASFLACSMGFDWRPNDFGRERERAVPLSPVRLTRPWRALCCSLQARGGLV